MSLPVDNIFPWSPVRKVLFRFFAIYFLLYQLGNLGFLSFLSDGPVTWMGKLLIKPDYRIEYWPGGSGDTTYNYLQICCLALLSFCICTIWSILDRNRKRYDKLLYWTLVLLRYGLALIMIQYGMAKVVKTQFPFPLLAHLDQTMGNISPMRLAWTYMGYSTGFNLFTGLAECFSGIFLLFRPTRLFGALLTMAVTFNIVMMNLCYDIPVKLFSTHLFLIATFIALPDLKRLISFFFLNKAVPAPNHWHPTFKTKWKRITFIVVKYAFLLIFFYITVSDGIAGYHRQMTKKVSPLYGIYEVKTVTTDNSGFSIALVNNFRYWQKVYIEQNDQLIARKKGNELQYYFMKIDTTKHLLSYWGRETENIELHYSVPEKDSLSLDGKIGTENIHVTLKRKDPNEFLLINRGFHWINEYPFNR